MAARTRKLFYVWRLIDGQLKVNVALDAREPVGVSGSLLSLDPVNPVGLSLQTIFRHNVSPG